jgi:hypothetical protein
MNQLQGMQVMQQMPQMQQMSIPDITMNGALEWSKGLFEKLGWMLLANSHGNVMKIENYKMSIMNCINAIKNKIAKTQEKDRQNDLTITLNNLIILQTSVNSMFPSQIRRGGKKKSII